MLEKQSRTEFIGMLGQLIPQLAQMIGSDPKTAPFCGELLKFAVAPFRAGRSLDGAIDELIENAKAKAEGPQPDDPTTASNKITLQIEQMKVDAKKQADQQEISVKQQDLIQKDRHAQEKLRSDEKMKALELLTAQGDEDAKAMLQNMKAMHEREKHQAHMLENQQKMDMQERKAVHMDMAARSRQNDLQARTSERQAAQQFKQQNELNKQAQGPL